LIQLSTIRCAVDILKGRLPGALAMLKARDASIAIRHTDDSASCEITFYFDRDTKSAGNAYRAIERIYEMTREQFPKR